MAQLYFYYSSMNAGKSTNLLQSAHNYKERGMSVRLYAYNKDSVSSRIGIQSPATSFDNSTDFSKILEDPEHPAVRTDPRKIDCILIDEAQFLTLRQVDDLAIIVDTLNIPVLCYGIRTDFQGELFSGSERLLAIADKLIELKGVCHCGRKATMVLRVGKDGKVLEKGPQELIGREDKYSAVCRKHFGLREPR